MKTKSKTASWLVPLLLIVLSFIPSAAGVSRLVDLSSNAVLNQDNARFHTTPLPVVIHIIGATLFCVLGALQFSTRFRARFPRWHRYTGRVLLVAGLAAAFSGIWMSLYYPLGHIQNDLLLGMRMLVGFSMAGAIILSFTSIIKRDFKGHQAWIIRAYALGQGAGTQVITNLVAILIFGQLDLMGIAIMMGAGWAINLIIGEIIIYRSSKS